MGIAPAVTPQGYHRLLDWLQLGFAAEMHYFAKRLDAYRDLSMVLPNTASVIVLVFPYRSEPAVAPEPGQGRVASYAWGSTDYHQLLHRRMDELVERLKSQLPGHQFRGVVDSAPVMEREFAQLAGLGWAGKNSLLLNKQLGSYFFLCCILTTAPLPSSEATESTAHCGTCTRCIDACPTEALVQPGVVDSRRCISYLTIEHRGPIATELRPLLGDWLFGCDVCQQVCPWNRFAPPTAEPLLHPRPEHNPIDLCELFQLDDDTFRNRFKATPLWRPRRRGLLRNAAICLGNTGSTAAIPALAIGLQDAEELIRGACAWALGQLGDDTARLLLQQQLSRETDAGVQQEIQQALANSTSSVTGT